MTQALHVTINAQTLYMLTFLNYCPQATKEQEQKEKEAARAKAEAEAKVSACPHCLAHGCCQAFAGPQTMVQWHLASPQRAARSCGFGRCACCLRMPL